MDIGKGIYEMCARVTRHSCIQAGQQFVGFMA